MSDTPGCRFYANWILGKNILDMNICMLCSIHVQNTLQTIKRTGMYETKETLKQDKNHYSGKRKHITQLEAQNIAAKLKCYFRSNLSSMLNK